MIDDSDRIDVLKSRNSIIEWAVSDIDYETEIKDHKSEEYVAWKIPANSCDVTPDPSNEEFRSFCAEQIVLKVEKLYYSTAHSGEIDFPYRVYGIITVPNLFSSEAGVVFNEARWRNLIHRNVHLKNYRETTRAADRNLFDDFGIIQPSWASTKYFQHEIHDEIDDVCFRGGFHVVWVSDDFVRRGLHKGRHASLLKEHSDAE